MQNQEGINKGRTTSKHSQTPPKMNANDHYQGQFTLVPFIQSININF